MEKIYTVTQINQYISELFSNDEELSYVAVKGEISNFTNHAASGHYYFTVKDNGSKLNCVMFKNYNKILKFVPQNGQSVVIRGYINSYVQRGEYQLYASSLEKEGTGELYKKFLELKEKLEAAGYFNPERKKKLPALPRRIGVITAPEGSVVCDIINVLKRRFREMPILIAPAYVQGALAADSISKALAYLNTVEDVDVIILARGGGSLEELWPFNEEKVANAIYNSTKPVISAVGHQTDFTISDFVSDLRAPTPSAAAELAVFPRNEALENLDNILAKYRNQMNLKIQRARGAVNIAAQKLAGHSPQRTFENRRMHIDNIHMKIAAALRQKMNNYSMRLNSLAPKAQLEKLIQTVKRYQKSIDSDFKMIERITFTKIEDARNALENKWLRFNVYDYKKVLNIGYSIVRQAAKNKIIKSSGDIKTGDMLMITLSDGTITARAEEVINSGKH